MHAVILEGLRIYPPLPFALPRVVPEGGDTVDGHFLPAGVRSSWAFASHMLTRFSDSCINKPSRCEPGPSQFRRSSRFQTRKMAWKERKGRFGRFTAILAWASGLHWTKVREWNFHLYIATN